MSDIKINKFLLPAQTTTFTCFPDLPGELQTQIWNAADPEPMTVKVKKSDHKVTRRRAGEGPGREVEIMLATAVYTVPAMLHACHDSRVAALPKFPMCFKEYLDRPVYFRYETDVLVIEEPETLTAFLKASRFAGFDVKLDDIAKIRNLGFGSKWISDQPRISMRLYLFSSLERLVFENLGPDREVDMQICKMLVSRRWSNMVRYQREVHKITIRRKAPIVEFR